MSKTNAGLIKNLLGLIQNGLFVTYKIEEVGGVLTGKHFETKEGLFNKPSCDSEQQRIDAMSASEIAEELEVLLNEITETNYDSALIDMYLEALEKKHQYLLYQMQNHHMQVFRKNSIASYLTVP